MNTDREWEKWGKKDPYYGVITDEKFRSENLTRASRGEFFESGRDHIDHVLSVCRRHLSQGFHPRRSLDFGCGTGRLVLPLADVSEQVVGLDVADSMLEEASEICKRNSVENVKLLKSDDNLSLLEGRFDFIHSFIVFQHIPVERGKRIFRKLLSHLEDGGICAIHFSYSNRAFREGDSSPRAGVIRNWWRALRRCAKRMMVRSSPSKDPEMQMNPYDLNELLYQIQTDGVEKMFTEFTGHGGELGVLLYFQKRRES